MTKRVTCRNVYGESFPTPISQLKQSISVYAVIIRDGAILLTRQWDGYSMVGGGVEMGESLEQALVREVHEETGLNIIPGKLRYHTSVFFRHRRESQGYHSHMFYFDAVDITGEISTSNITQSENSYTTGIPEWVPLSQLGAITFRHSVQIEDILQHHSTEA